MIDGFPVAEVLSGPWTDRALLGLVVLLVLTGRLVAARERDYWRRAFFEEQDQKRQLLESNRVTRDVLRALPAPPPDEGASDQ